MLHCFQNNCHPQATFSFFQQCWQNDTKPGLCREQESTDEFHQPSREPITDFFARLCVVEASGKSINLCDGILRLTAGSVTPQPDGSLHITIEVWPTAYRFRKGQRMRVQISSGAHPRFARNTGTGEPLATGTKLRVADQMVYHDPEHPSAILLPVLSA